jgi:hypothetical protein
LNHVADDTIERDKNGHFVSGQSGNPQGRPRGVGKIAALRAKLDDNIEGIVGVLHAAALRGNLTACRVLLDRSYPAYRPTERPEPVELPGDSLTEKARAVMDGVARGEIAPSTASELLTALDTMGRIAMTDELVTRIAALEKLAREAPR